MSSARFRLIALAAALAVIAIAAGLTRATLLAPEAAAQSSSPGDRNDALDFKTPER